MLPMFVQIVDSDPRFLEIATRFLQKRTGVLVYSAISTGDEILRQADVFEPDILLYNLSDSDSLGLKIIRKLRDKFPRITIIVVSPPENEYFKQAVMEAGANDFILRTDMSFEFLPAIWGLVTMYQQRYGKSGVGTIPGKSNPFWASSSVVTPNLPPFIN